MKWIPFFLLLLFFPFLVDAQIVFDKTEYDFGKMDATAKRYVDFFLQNKTKEDVFILSVDLPMEISYLQSSSLISPDSTAILRLQINRRKEGQFLYEIPIYTSNKKLPTIVRLKGRITVPPAESFLTQCPNFKQRPADKSPQEFILTVETVDMKSRESVGNAKVIIIKDGFVLGKWNTNAMGKLKVKIPMGIAYFYGTHPGYTHDEKGKYINFKRKHVTLELTKEKRRTPVVAEVTIPPIKEPKLSSKDDAIVVIDVEQPSKEVDISKLLEKETPKTEMDSIIPPSWEEWKKGDFKSSYFASINVVFVIDVSGSMSLYDRIDLLKYSLNRLVDMLRPQDKMGLVSYASKTNVLLPPTAGNHKEEIKEKIKDLEAYGFTAGEAGIKLGYLEVEKSKIEGGVNQVIIITDGGFNQDSKHYKEFIKNKFKQENISMSVVGIKCGQGAKKNMKDAASSGNGRFISINNLKDAQTKLNQEIRLATFKES